ncbi:MAG TPA: gamma-glutamyltransferase [Longimicrobiales bacterium]|nr:gamma-glutamyltransferase [Longimicrobiales bacterium]
MAGAAVLEAGGNAIDAALTAALTTTVVGMGAPVSLAGVGALVYYDAETGTTHALDGGWVLPAGEPDVSSIPSDAPSGRAIMVPGFMALVQAAHDRFGRLPFAALFEPAIHVAERGFTLTEDLARSIEGSGEVLGRRAATEWIFLGEDGEWPRPGEVFRQPELAETLRRLATDGADYMYRGDWAEALVEAVHEEGGHLTLDDLSSYQATWSETAAVEYGTNEIHVPGGDNAGGTALLEAMLLLDRAGVRDSGPVFESAESLYWVSRIGYLLWVADFRQADFEGAFPELSMDLASRRTSERADVLWDLLQTPRWDEFVGSDPYSAPASAPPAHTDAIVTVDRWGNAAALIFSSTIVGWGRTGIFVDGVSVPDFGRTASRLAGLRPGDRIPNQLNPVLVLGDEGFVAGLSSLGAGIHHASVQTLLNVLDFGMAPVPATTTPQVAHFAWPGAPGVPEGTPVQTHLVEAGRFPPALLDSVRAQGQPVLEIPGSAAYDLLGRVSLIVADPTEPGVRGIGSTGGLAVPERGSSRKP